jgi:hypothetical protein
MYSQLLHKLSTFCLVFLVRFFHWRRPKNWEALPTLETPP